MEVWPVEQVHAVLGRPDSVRDLGEVTSAQFLLALQAERAVVGGYRRHVTCAEVAPGTVGGLLLRLPRARHPVEIRPGLAEFQRLNVLRGLAGFVDDGAAGDQRGHGRPVRM
jgi:hypothetical protein